MQPYYEKGNITLYHGDLRDVLPKAIQPNTVDFVVTDPPYGLSFMERDWDFEVPGPTYWETIASVCKPGALLLAFGGSPPSTVLPVRSRTRAGRFGLPHVAARPRLPEITGHLEGHRQGGGGGERSSARPAPSIASSADIRRSTAPGPRTAGSERPAPSAWAYQLPLPPRRRL